MDSRFKELLKDEKGFSLIELIVAIALLALIVGSMLGAFVTSTKDNITARSIIDEGYLAQEWMEEVYSLSVSKNMTQLKDVLESNDPVTGYKFDYTPNPASKEHSFKKKIDRYYVKIEIKEEPYVGVREEIKRVIVEIFKDDTYTNSLAIVQNYLIIK